MADKVLVKLPTGELVLRSLEDISVEELKYPKFCAGENDMGPCMAEMSASIVDGKPKKFYQAHHNKATHVIGCNYDKRPDESRFGHLDKRCRDVFSANLLKWMSKRRQNHKENDSGDDSSEVYSYDNEKGSSDNTKERTITRVGTPPSTPSILAEVLESQSLQDLFMEGYVRDFILDHRTINHYSKNGLPENRPVVVLMKKIASENVHLTDRKKWEYVFADCTYNARKNPDIGECLQFRVQDYSATKAITKMLKDLDDEYIVLFCEWIRDERNRNTYVAVDAAAGLVGHIKFAKCQIAKSNE